MLKPNTPDIPGMSAMTDTLEFMKNLWGGMGNAGAGIPAMVMPTLSVEEINKQITDLKAVESWLTMNMNMLRGTIQALEVQSATISALQSMGQAFSSAGGSNAAGAASTAAAFPVAQTKAQTPADEKPQAEAAPAPTPSNGSKRKSASEPKSEAESEPAVQRTPAPAAQPDAANMATPLANPAVWWNMLQDQFNQAVGTAMSSQAAPPAAKPAPAEPRKRKPRSKS